MAKEFDRQKLNEYLNSYYQKNGNSGVLRVTVRDRVIYEAYLGYADMEKKQPFSEHSLFTLYSLSKPFCAIALLKLKDKRLIDLDAHPMKYVPEAGAFDERVTVRQLLHHTSGLPDFDQDTDFRKRYQDGTPKQIRGQLKELSKIPILFEPGTDSKYANINFILCALIIENVSGMSYEDYMKKEVFVPLGMNRTYVDHKDIVVSDRVKGYIRDGKCLAVEPVTDWTMGAADLLSDVDDVYCLNKAIKHCLLLKPETWEEALTPIPLNSMGMGCTVSEWHGKRRITHNGGWRGFRTLHIQLPEDDFDIIFLSNAGWGDARKDFAEAVYEAFYGGESAVTEDVKMDIGYL